MFKKKIKYSIATFSLPVHEAIRSTAIPATAAETTIIFAEKQKEVTSSKSKHVPNLFSCGWGEGEEE